MFFSLSVKEILSPGDTVKDGMLTFLSLTLIPLCLIIWRDSAREEPIPALYNNESNLLSSNCNSKSPVTPFF